MIEIAGTAYAFDDPLVLAALGAGLLVLLVLILLIMAVRRAGRSANLMTPMIHQMNALGQRVETLTAGQQQLAGGLTHVSEAQAASQAQMLRLMEQRLAEVSTRMQENLQGTATRTAHSLGELQQRLVTIDRAQANIEKLSGDVLSLQDILSNKQTRGAFGEIQLHDIVSKALPSDAYALQATLSNGRRADCLIHLPNPPGPKLTASLFTADFGNFFLNGSPGFPIHFRSNYFCNSGTQDGSYFAANIQGLFHNHPVQESCRIQVPCPR